MIQQEPLSFPCTVCGQPPRHLPEPMEGFDGVAYENMVEWTEFSDRFPEMGEGNWTYCETPPAVGEKRVVRVCHPFHFAPGQPFTVLYTNGNAAINGWDEHPEDIARSAIVTCRFEDIIEKYERSAWLQVTATDVLSLPALGKQSPGFEDRGYLEKFGVYGPVRTHEMGDWTQYSCSAQGDLGEWALVYSHPDGSRRLVLYSYWDFHADDVHYGNGII